MIGYVLFVLAVGAERLVELAVSKRNLTWAFANGGREYGRGHYPAMVLLHFALLVGCVVEVWVFDRPFLPALGWTMVAVVLSTQALRWWCISTLGRRWNTLIVVIPGLRLVNRGPYRWLRHPNYVAVVIEGVALPMVHTAWITAVTFTVLNAFLLRVRIRAEEDALTQATTAEPMTEESVPASPGSMIDLLIAGAGPAGLATALYAARAGLDVTVVDPRAAVEEPGKPIDKACGEGLMPGAVLALAELGVEPKGRPYRGIGYVAGEHRAEALFRSGFGLGVRRTDLHTSLLSAVRAAGVPVLSRAVSAVTQDENSVCAADLTARYLVAADGLHSPITRSLSLDAPVRGARQRWGLRRHYRIRPWSDLVQVHWSAHSEAYVTPVGPELVGVAVLSGDRAGFDAQLAAFPALVERLAGSEGGSVRGAGPLRRRTSSRVAGRVLLVGDAAGYVDALTGEGIAVSLACAGSLVDCVAAGRPEDYEMRWRRDSRRYRALTSSLLWASGRRSIRRAIVPAAQRVPWVFSGAVAQLAR